MERVKVYHVWWEKFQIDEIYKKQNIGLYQVYGDHIVYGRNVLLYIGQTKRDINMRLKEHDDFNETNINTNSLMYYFGEIYKSDDVNEGNLEKIIDEVETILLKSHYPSYNSNEIKGLIWQKDYYNSIVLNWNNYGALLPEVSGLRFSSKYWDDWNKKAHPFRPTV